MKRIDCVWDACPEGEIRRLVGTLRFNQHRRLFAKWLIAVSILVISGTVGLLYRFIN